MACREFKTNAPISASTADDITFFMIFAVFGIIPLPLGSVALSDKKKWPPTLLFALGLHRGMMHHYVRSKLCCFCQR